MAEHDGGDPGTTPEDDPFAQLLDPGFADRAEIREPTAAERARRADREARAADLQRRLAEQAATEREEAERELAAEQRATRTAARRGRLARILGPIVVIALVAGSVYLIAGGGGGDGGSDQPVGARPADYPPPAKGVSATPLGEPPEAPDETGPYDFAATQRGGDDPVAWDPCRPIRFVVNTDGELPGAGEMLGIALARTSAATGLHLQDEGTTDEPAASRRDPYQPDRYGEQWAPVLIAWTDGDHVDELQGDVAGLGGGSVAGLSEGRDAYVSGAVLLDREDLRRALDGPGGQEAVVAVIQHELGHLVGLDHVGDPAELMHSESTPTTLDWGPGDLHGLNRLGKGPCIPEL